MAANTLPPNTPFLDDRGFVRREWWSFLNSLTRVANDASAGSVTTNPGSGLAGGGSVSDGVSLIIAPNGVSNSMIRQSAGNSVIGRSASSSGNVADITASLNNSVLTRRGNTTFFSPTLVLAGELECGSLAVNDTETTAVVAQASWIPITVNGSVRKLLLGA